MNTNIPDTKTHGHSPLVVRLVVTVCNCVNCVIYSMTLAAQDANIALELLTRQYNIPFLNVHFIYHYDLTLL